MKNASSSSPVNTSQEATTATENTNSVNLQNDNPKLYSSRFFFISSRIGLSSLDHAFHAEGAMPISPKEEVDSICATLSRKNTECTDDNQREFVANVPISSRLDGRLSMPIGRTRMIFKLF